jgi:hypothetical protein
VLHRRLVSGVAVVVRSVLQTRRGAVEARIDSGIGDVRINVPEGVQARIKVDRGIGGLRPGSRFRRRGDYYETENFSRAESYIDLEVDTGIGSVTIR